jgi:hypothetical protein
MEFYAQPEDEVILSVFLDDEDFADLEAHLTEAFLRIDPRIAAQLRFNQRISLLTANGAPCAFSGQLDECWPTGLRPVHPWHLAAAVSHPGSPARRSSSYVNADFNPRCLGTLVVISSLNGGLVCGCGGISRNLLQ